MSFVTFYDANPVIIDDLGLPLQGRLQFYSIGTTTLKGIYQDLVGTSALNPQFTDSTGKLQNQIFLGVGDYTVYYQRYLGSDISQMYTAPDVDFITFKQEQIPGATALPTNSSPNTITVNTIADLRNVDPAYYNTVTVIGYYTSGDKITPRTYTWNALSISNDNFGTIIKGTVQNSGRWLMNEPEEMDVRYFGIFPNGTPYNSNLAALNSWVTGSVSTCKSIRFPTGNYTFASNSFIFTTKVIIEQNTKFINSSSSGTLDLHFQGDYDIQTISALVLNAAALNTVRVYFDGVQGDINHQVKSCWYGNWQDYANGDQLTLSAIGQRVGTKYDLYITNTLYILSGTSTLVNDNVFISNGGTLVNRGGILQFSGCNVSNLTTFAGITTATSGSFINYQFINSTVRSSCFYGVGIQIPLTCQQNSTNSTFIFDSDVVIASFTDIGGFRFKRESGIMSSNTTEVYAVFNTFDLPCGQRAFSETAYIGLKNQETHVEYFYNTNSNNALYSAIRCALFGNGILNLNTKEWAVNVNNNIKNSGNGTVLIKNGIINAGASITVMNVQCGLFEVRFDDVNFYTNSSAALLRVDNAGSITRVSFENCFVTSNGTVFGTANGGTILFFNVRNCYVHAQYLLNEISTGVDEIFITNNYDLTCDLIAYESKPLVSNNYIAGNGPTRRWEIKNKNSAIINGNRFYQCDLYLRDNAGTIDHVVTSNQFESTNSKWSRIVFNATSSETKFVGANISNNSFIGSPSNLTCILAQGSFSTSADHHMLITNNSGDTVDKIIPMTKGTIFQAQIDKNLHYWMYFSQNPNIFYIPGTYPNVKYVNVQNYLGTNNPGAFTGANAGVTLSGLDAYLVLSFTGAPAASTTPLYANTSIDIY